MKLHGQRFVILVQAISLGLDEVTLLILYQSFFYVLHSDISTLIFQ